MTLQYKKYECRVLNISSAMSLWDYNHRDVIAQHISVRLPTCCYPNLFATTSIITMVWFISVATKKDNTMNPKLLYVTAYISTPSIPLLLEYPVSLEYPSNKEGWPNGSCG